MDGGVVEQVPRYSMETLDDGKLVKLRILVKLPGVETAAKLRYVLLGDVEQPADGCRVHVPGVYKLELRFPHLVDRSQPSICRFNKAKQTLRLEMTVLEDKQGRPISPAASSSSHSSAQDSSRLSRENSTTSTDHILADSATDQAHVQSRVPEIAPKASTNANGAFPGPPGNAPVGKQTVPVTPHITVPSTGTETGTGSKGSFLPSAASAQKGKQRKGAAQEPSDVNAAHSSARQQEQQVASAAEAASALAGMPSGKPSAEGLRRGFLMSQTTSVKEQPAPVGANQRAGQGAGPVCRQVSDHGQAGGQGSTVASHARHEYTAQSAQACSAGGGAPVAAMSAAAARDQGEQKQAKKQANASESTTTCGGTVDVHCAPGRDAGTAAGIRVAQERMYSEAVLLANKDTAEQLAQRAEALRLAGDLPNAVKQLAKADRMTNGAYAQQLAQWQQQATAEAHRHASRTHTKPSGASVHQAGAKVGLSQEQDHHNSNSTTQSVSASNLQQEPTDSQKHTPDGIQNGRGQATAAAAAQSQLNDSVEPPADAHHADSHAAAVSAEEVDGETTMISSPHAASHDPARTAATVDPVQAPASQRTGAGSTDTAHNNQRTSKRKGSAGGRNATPASPRAASQSAQQPHVGKHNSNVSKSSKEASGPATPPPTASAGVGSSHNVVAGDSSADQMEEPWASRAYEWLLLVFASLSTTFLVGRQRVSTWFKGLHVQESVHRWLQAAYAFAVLRWQVVSQFVVGTTTWALQRTIAYLANSRFLQSNVGILLLGLTQLVTLRLLCLVLMVLVTARDGVLFTIQHVLHWLWTLWPAQLGLWELRWRGDSFLFVVLRSDEALARWLLRSVLSGIIVLPLYFVAPYPLRFAWLMVVRPWWLYSLLWTVAVGILLPKEHCGALAVPLLWHCTGGGSAAALGTVAALLLGRTSRRGMLSVFICALTFGLAHARLGWGATWLGATCLGVLTLAAWALAWAFLDAFDKVDPERRDGPGAKGPATSVPQGALGEVKRILQAETHYEVLEVSEDVTEADLRAAKKRKALVTHPDKVGSTSTGANEAFAKVTQAYEVLSDPGRRYEYDQHLAAQAAAAEDMAVHHVDCDYCGLFHPVVMTGRSAEAGRYCGVCDTMHPVSDKDVWVEEETGGLFRRKNRRMFFCEQGFIYECTQLGLCTGIIHRISANAHSIGTPHANATGGAGAAGSRGRHGSSDARQGPFKGPDEANGYKGGPSAPRPGQPAGPRKKGKKGRRK